MIRRVKKTWIKPSGSRSQTKQELNRLGAPLERFANSRMFVVHLF